MTYQKTDIGISPLVYSSTVVTFTWKPSSANSTAGLKWYGTSNLIFEIQETSLADGKLRNLYSNTSNAILDISHRPVFRLKHGVSETEF
jgi:hypothetical protein